VPFWGPHPVTPADVPVSALLTGAGGSFPTHRFRVTPSRPPWAGNGNRSLLFPLIRVSAVTSK